jgi:hypothetical protein
MLLLCLSWFSGGAYFSLYLVNVLKRGTLGQLEWIEQHSGHKKHSDEPWERQVRSTLDIVNSSLDAVNASLDSYPQMQNYQIAGDSMGIETLDVRWPNLNMRPTALACDTHGKQLVVANRFRTFVADLSAGVTHTKESEKQMQIGRLEASATVSKQRLRATEAPNAIQQLPNVHFRDLPCSRLRGEALLDATVLCDAGTDSECHALFLHRHGRRISSCSLMTNSGSSSFEHRGLDFLTANLSDEWLERSRHADTRGHAALFDKPISFAADSDCWSSIGVNLPEHCAGAFVGTSHGRVVQLQQHHSKRSEFIPAQVVEEGEARSSQQLESIPKAIRVLGRGFIGVLQAQKQPGHGGQLIQVLDLQRGGAKSGQLRLPEGLNAVSFCAGGGFLYFLSDDPSPHIFRVPRPSELGRLDELSVGLTEMVSNRANPTLDDHRTGIYDSIAMTPRAYHFNIWLSIIVCIAALTAVITCSQRHYQGTETQPLKDDLKTASLYGV